MTKILKIKYHGTRLLPLSRRFRLPRFSFVVDSVLDEILEPLKIKTIKNANGVSKNYVVIHTNSNMVLDNNHIFFEVSDVDENFINTKINTSDKIKNAHNNKEFEIAMKKEIEL